MEYSALIFSDVILFTKENIQFSSGVIYSRNFTEKVPSITFVFFVIGAIHFELTHSSSLKIIFIELSEHGKLSWIPSLHIS